MRARGLSRIGDFQHQAPEQRVINQSLPLVRDKAFNIRASTIPPHCMQLRLSHGQFQSIDRLWQHFVQAQGSANLLANKQTGESSLSIPNICSINMFFSIVTSYTGVLSKIQFRWKLRLTCTFWANSHFTSASYLPTLQRTRFTALPSRPSLTRRPTAAAKPHNDSQQSGQETCGRHP